jgi:hypothetical protein
VTRPATPGARATLCGQCPCGPRSARFTQSGHS